MTTVPLPLNVPIVTVAAWAAPQVPAQAASATTALFHCKDFMMLRFFLGLETGQ